MKNINFLMYKIKENLPNNKNYNVYEFVKSPMILNTDNFNEVVVPKDSFVLVIIEIILKIVGI